jgi:NADH-quinone oxidoreductase subunit H
MITVSALATTLVLGGWRAPWPITALWPGEGSPNEGWWPLLWWFSKIVVFLFVFIWLRGTLPRLRYDQFMKLGWKVLIPASLAWIVLVATIEAFRTEGNDFRDLLPWLGGGLAVVILLFLAWDWAVSRQEKAAQEARAAESEEAFDPFAGGHPVPPMPGQQLPDRPRIPVAAGSLPTEPTQPAEVLTDSSGEETGRG